MTYSRARNAYRQTDVQAEIHPVKLIHMMYDRILIHLDDAVIGVERNDPRKRGENIGKAIALITELNASVRSDDESETACFLRGLYESILLELPKASINNDVQVLRQAHKYIKKLKEVWEQTAMRENGLDGSLKKSGPPAPAEQEHRAPARSPQGLSFSI